jgi:hypothetical protein
MPSPTWQALNGHLAQTPFQIAAGWVDSIHGEIPYTVLLPGLPALPLLPVS